MQLDAAREAKRRLLESSLEQPPFRRRSLCSADERRAKQEASSEQRRATASDDDDKRKEPQASRFIQSLARKQLVDACKANTLGDRSALLLWLIFERVVASCKLTAERASAEPPPDKLESS